MRADIQHFGEIVSDSTKVALKTSSVDMSFCAIFTSKVLPTQGSLTSIMLITLSVL